MAMDRQEFLDLCPVHALGLLDGEDLARFREALGKAQASADRELLAAHRDAVNAAANLSLAAPEAPLSPRVLGRLMARVEGPAAPAPSAPGTGSFPARPRIAWILPFRIAAAVAAGLTLVAAGLFSYAASLRENLGRAAAVVAESRGRIQALEDSLAQKNAMLDVLKSADMQMVVLAGQEADPAGYGKIIWDPARKKAILHISNLPVLPADKDYQLWVIRDKQPVDAGVFQVKGNREGGELYKIDRLVESDKSRINAFAITLEPKGGLPQPSGKMYLLGSI
ncbi:MAG TPA: anti-sigma factor [Fibrobacteria bacterium]|nr:anti-sigma factor [Fibrobacteria bacterium]